MPLNSYEWERRPCARCRRLISEKNLILVETVCRNGEARYFNRFALCPSCWKDMYDYTFPEGRTQRYDW